MNEDEEEFSESGVISFFQNQANDVCSEKLNESLLNTLNTFSMEDPNLSDDITMLTIRAL